MTTTSVNQNRQSAVLIRKAHVVKPDGIVAASLLINGDRIARIFESPADEPTTTASLIDLDWCTLFPGFIDIHIHGAVGVDMMEAQAGDIRRVGKFLARNGVTSWLPTFVPSLANTYARAAHAVTEAMAIQETADPVSGQDAAGARILGIHYEGPFVNSAQCGALHAECFRSFSNIRELDTLPTIKHDHAIHMMTLAPEIEGGIALVRELTRRGWIISIGHTQAVEGVLEQAMSAGARHMTHFMNAMTPLHHRTLGAVGWGLIRNEVTCDVIADGVHIAPAILRLVVNSKTADRVSLISDAVAAAGLGDGEYEIWGEKIVVKNGRTQNEQGHIAGSVISIAEAVRKMRALGFAEGEVARMAALNPAKLLRIDHDCGSIEEGKRADLVALDDHHKVRFTMIGGQIAFQS